MREKPELHAAVQPHPCLPHRGCPRYPPRITHNATRRFRPATPNTATTAISVSLVIFSAHTPCQATVFSCSTNTLDPPTTLHAWLLCSISLLAFWSRQDVVFWDGGGGGVFRRGCRALAASEKGKEVGLREAGYGFGEEVHDHDRGIGEVDVSEVAVNNRHLLAP